MTYSVIRPYLVTLLTHDAIKRTENSLPTKKLFFSEWQSVFRESMKAKKRTTLITQSFNQQALRAMRDGKYRGQLSLLPESL